MKQQPREAWYPLQSIWRTHNTEEDEEFCKAAWPVRVPRVHQPVKMGTMEAHYQQRVFNKTHLTCSYVWKRNTSPDSGSFQNLVPPPEKNPAFHARTALSSVHPLGQKPVWGVHLQICFLLCNLVLFHMDSDGMAGITKHGFRKPYHWQSKGDVRRFLLNFVLNQDTGYTRDDFI